MDPATTLAAGGNLLGPGGLMTPLQAVLFGLGIAMVLVWFAAVARLSRMLRERHEAKYDEMGLEFLWPQGLGDWVRGYNNSRPARALMRFLYRGEDAPLRDAELSRLATFLRWFFCAYVVVLLGLCASIVLQVIHPPVRLAPVAPTAEEARHAAFRLHRAERWDEAIAAYDRLLGEGEADAQLHHWRGIAHWKLGRAEPALQDLRRAIALEPANFDARYAASHVLREQRRWDEIVALWDPYLAAHPTRGEAYLERGGAHYAKQDFAAARADAESACRLGRSEACPVAERQKGR